MRIVDRRLDEVIAHTDLDANLLGQLHAHGGAAVGLDVFRLPAVTLNPRESESTHFRAEERLEDIAQFVGAHDRDHEFHDRPPALSSSADVARTGDAAFGRASRRMSSAPSPRT